MKPTTFEEALDEILALQREVMLDRHQKYGPDNMLKAGIEGALSRAYHDKMSRLFLVYENRRAMQACRKAGMPENIILKYFSDTEDFADETVEDAHIDAANYVGPISLMLARGTWTLPMSKEKVSVFN